MFFIGLFSGAGGLDHGFVQSGFKAAVLSDFWSPAVETLKINNPSASVCDLDVSKLSEDIVLKSLQDLGLSKEDINVVVGGPPCQAFSRLNQNQLFESGESTEVNINDPRRSLFMEFLRVVGYIKPKFVVMENVSDIAVRRLGGNTSEKNRLIVEVIEEEFNKSGYDITYAVLKASDYNVPQLRKRMVFLGIRKDFGITPSLPEPFGLYTSVKEQFSTIKDSDPNHIFKSHTDEWRNKVSFIPQGGYYKDLPLNLKVLKEVSIDYVCSYTGQWRNFCFTNKEGIQKEFDTVWKEANRKKLLFVKYENELFDLDTFIEGVIGETKIFRIMPRMGTYLRRISYNVSHTVTRNPLIHPEENREITVREKAAIQTFPNNYEFCGTNQEQHILLGNAVPCNMAKIIADHIKNLDN